jgi:hypothetical protein
LARWIHLRPGEPPRRRGRRARGVGGALVEHFVAWAAQQDTIEASVSAYAANEPVQHLYRRHVLTPQTITLRTAVPATAR